MLIFRLLRILRARLAFYGSVADSRPTGKRRRARQREDPGPRASSQSANPGDEVDPVLAGYYANLEVPYGSDLETVREAWKRLLRKYHPDLHSTDPEKRRLATELTQGLNRAYEELERRLG